MIGIMIEQSLQQRVELRLGIAPRRGHPLRQHVPPAAADHRAKLRDGQRIAPDAGQRVVHRRGQIAAGIEQRSIEVETHDVEPDPVVWKTGR